MIRSLFVCALIFRALGTPGGLPAWETLHPEASRFADFDIRENTEIRELCMDTITAPTSEVLETVRRVFTQRGQDNRVSMEVRTSRKAFYILFLNEEEGKFPVFSRGSWIIKRDIATGDFLQVKIFFHSDPGSFVRIFPDAGGKSLMDVYLFDRRIQRNVPLGLNFVNLLSCSFAGIVEATGKTVNWRGLIPRVDASAYENVENASRRIRSLLPELREVEDGAMDKEGGMVFIETLLPQPEQGGFNCSGFVKWAADGLYAPLAGRLLDIRELKAKPLGARGSFISRRFEDARDPFFGLDWSRNIALAFRRLESGRAGETGSCDVRELPYWKYMQDIGFPAADLPAIMYYLALNEPGNIYIASVNREFGKDPVLRQHTHVAALFPAIDEAGKFSCPVMDTNEETSLEPLMRRGDFIHLVRVKAPPEFNPPGPVR
ncbi:MAG: hypothetical protein LBT33_00590 [Spirochaetia bacterium]|jgi:hypothetical protein|nr:hypothetical protein [Spirochaetia bacterium]